jgi:hypothetical protein
MKTLAELIVDAERELEDQVQFVRSISEMSLEQELASLLKIQRKQRIRENGMRPSDVVNTENAAYFTALDWRIKRLQRQLGVSV